MGNDPVPFLTGDNAMPKEITKTIRTFGEMIEAEKEKKVSSNAVERARSLMQQYVTQHDWWDSVYEDWKQALKQIGFDNVEINFSGFSCQGDGACFTADVDLKVLIKFLANPPAASEVIGTLKGTKDKEDFGPWIVHKVGGVKGNPEYKKLLKVIDDCSAKVERGYRTGNYSHSGTCDFVGEYNGPEKHDKLWDEFVSQAEEFRRELSDAIYDALEQEHDSRMEDEYLIEECDELEIYFNVDGGRERAPE